MFNALRRLGEMLFQRQTLLAIVQDELYKAEVDLLALRTASEYTQGLIDYRTKQIARLKAGLREMESNK